MDKDDAFWFSVIIGCSVGSLTDSTPTGWLTFGSLMFVQYWFLHLVENMRIRSEIEANSKKFNPKIDLSK